MRNFKKILLFLLIFSAILAPFVLMVVFDGIYTLYPTSSAPHTLTFICYSGYYNNPIITLRQYDRQGELLCENELAITTGISEQQVQEYEFPEWIGESVDLCVNLYDKEPPLPVIHFPSTSELEENGVLIYLLNDTEQYAYFISGKHRLIFFKPEDSDQYEQVSDAPSLKKLPPLYPHDGRAIPPKPPSDWKEHTWVTAGADG